MSNNLDRAVVVSTKTILTGNKKRSVIDECMVSSGLNDIATKELCLGPGQEAYFTVNNFLMVRASDKVQLVIDVGQPFDTNYLCCMAMLGTITITNTNSYNVALTILYG